MNKTVLIIVVIVGIIAGAAYWYYYRMPAQTTIEENSASVVSEGAGTLPENDTSAAIDQDVQNIDLNGSGTDFQEIDNNLNNL
ncbi:hypothetical protein HZB04_02465 [Candidatus Wolfebacteria bacterium]|nr:hypothetical protein [Candidatus Wolfebacteria bacterium]